MRQFCWQALQFISSSLSHYVRPGCRKAIAGRQRLSAIFSHINVLTAVFVVAIAVPRLATAQACTGWWQVCGGKTAVACNCDGSKLDNFCTPPDGMPNCCAYAGPCAEFNTCSNTCCVPGQVGCALPLRDAGPPPRNPLCADDKCYCSEGSSAPIGEGEPFRTSWS